MVYGVLDYYNNTSSLWINGVQRASNTSQWETSSNTSNTNSNTRLTIGTNTNISVYTDFDLAYLSVKVNNKLTTTEINKLFGWCAHHYGIQNKLPSNHPYRYNPPGI